MNKKNGVVVIPIYRKLTREDTCSFKQCLKVLGEHPIVVVHPNSLDIDDLRNKNSKVQFVAMHAKHFVSVSSYNEMMLNPSFYEQFQEYEYMLIYQLDAYVFEDRLNEWIDFGYDYIGAPWIPNDNLWTKTCGRIILSIKKMIPPTTKKISHANLYYNVGNGGFSLRKISKMIEILSKNAALISTLEQGSTSRQEDVLLSILLSKKSNLKMPSWKKALEFSFENAPQLCYRKIGNKLPFGCHYWTNRKNWNLFWHKYISLNS